MSSGYVSGPSRSAWEGASFWQRMNPGSMSLAPHIGYNDALDLAFPEIAPDATGSPYSGEWDVTRLPWLGDPEWPSLARRWAHKAKYAGLVLAELSRLKLEREAQEVPW